MTSARSPRPHSARPASRGRQALGVWGEETAVAHLRTQGYAILCRNYRTPAGELDIVAEDKGAIVFVEVKTRRNTRFGSPAEAITSRKASHLLHAAQHYLQETGQQERGWRIDVVAIEHHPHAAPTVTLIRNAVEGEA